MPLLRAGPPGVLTPRAALAARTSSHTTSCVRHRTVRTVGPKEDEDPVPSSDGAGPMDGRDNRALRQGLNSNQTLPGGPGTTPQVSAEASTSRRPNPPARSPGGRSTMCAPLADVGCSTSTRTWSSSASIRRWIRPTFGCNPAWRTALLTSSVTARRGSSERPFSEGGGMASSTASRARWPALWCTGRTRSLRRICRSFPSRMRQNSAHGELSHRIVQLTAPGGRS